MNQVLLAAIAFVGSHFILSHPLRAPLVGRIGERGFLGLYSIVSLVTFGWLIFAYATAPTEPALWVVGDLLWALGSVATLVASILFLGSLLGNPAFPDPTGTTKPVPEARGVFAITRHPMMWGFALWGVAHILVFPTPSNIILSGAIVVLALVGAALQEGKKAVNQPDFWPAWQAKTSYWPFAAIAAGSARLGGFRGHDLIGGLVIWLAASWAHLPFAGWDAGIWRWLG